uniref:Nibrin n=1 Tax=Sphenodon punctatus TaxID=8508 RepID=A0A8D0GJ15_SPHPU
MWKLVPVAEPGPEEPYRFLVGKVYVVGRKNCAILIQDDQSISRAHAVLTVSHPKTDLSQLLTSSLLTLKDTSKYGTTVNGEKLQNGIPRSLKSGDRITFGVFKSKYRVEYEPLIVSSSCLDGPGKTDLNNIVLQLGGHTVNDWTEECTHLAMISVKVTVKTICALICGRPIIKPEYFAQLIKAIESKQQLPKLESFYPLVDEPSIGRENVDLSTCQERKIIFQGKTFIFLTAKQHAKLSPAIILGGGEAKLMMEGEKETSLLIAPEVCVVDVGLTKSPLSVPDSVRKLIDSVMAVLQSKSLRAIPEAEIGLAVIFISTEKYCNPQSQLDAATVPASQASAVPGSSLSQSSAVDETVMVTTACNITAYVAETEVEEQTNACMEVRREKKVKETLRMEHRGKTYSQNISTVKETPNTSGSVNAGTGLSRSRMSVIEQNTQPLSPTKVSGVGRYGSSQQQSNSIKNYFQTVTKKRERNEEGETSLPKLTKMEEKPSSNSQTHTQPMTSLTWKNKVEPSQKEQYTKMNLSPVDTSMQLRVENRKLDKTVDENIPCEKSTTKKRKELDDLTEDAAALELVFESKELDLDEDMEDHGQQNGTNIKKKRKLETKEGGVQVGNIMHSEARRVLPEHELGSVPTLSKKCEIKQESSDSAKSLSNSPDKLQDGSSNLPSRLLLSEFRSLIVTIPRQISHFTAKTDYGQLKNFKKFKKVAYPGAGQLPHIIGGSDLVAHHTKKNSELEEWLKQEMEEQNRYAREESLADDLFRYDPSVKRRR